MHTGAITNHIDVAQLVLYAFWIFFAGLILYIRREDKREGYPLESERSAHIRVQGFPAMPSPKTYLLPHGGSIQKPDGRRDSREVLASASAPWPGAPLEPNGDPMRDAVGPAAHAARADAPDLAFDGTNKILPLRVAGDFGLNASDPDPRGLQVIAGDRKVAGVVTDVWVDRSEPQVRFYEVEVAGSKRHVLLPVGFARVDWGGGHISVRSIFAEHFEHVPALRNADQVTLLEEDRICAYYGGGTLYATPDRLGPWL